MAETARAYAIVNAALLGAQHWSIIGGVAHATQHMRLVIGVTYPTARMHPAVMAQAAATVAAMMPGRWLPRFRNRRISQQAPVGEALASSSGAVGDARGSCSGDPPALAGWGAESLLLLA
jgi:hypothetical protein